MHTRNDVAWYVGRRIDVHPELLPSAVASLAGPGGSIRCESARARLVAGPCSHPARGVGSAPVACLEGVLRARGRGPVPVAIDMHGWSRDTSELGLRRFGRSFQWTPGRSARFFEAAHQVLQAFGTGLERAVEHLPEGRRVS